MMRQEFSKTLERRQDVNHHVHWVPFYHFLTLGILTILLIASCFNAWVSDFSVALVIQLFTIASTISVAFHCRSFALKVQDRAVRAEENFRYYILTGKPLSNRLTLEQIIALRFASDDELPTLVNETLDQDLSSTDIKKLILKWRPDHLRA
jgi:hypothetical protein